MATCVSQTPHRLIINTNACSTWCCIPPSESSLVTWGLIKLTLRDLELHCAEQLIPHHHNNSPDQHVVLRVRWPELVGDAPTVPLQLVRNENQTITIRSSSPQHITFPIHAPKAAHLQRYLDRAMLLLLSVELLIGGTSLAHCALDVRTLLRQQIQGTWLWQRSTGVADDDGMDGMDGNNHAVAGSVHVQLQSSMTTGDDRMAAGSMMRGGFDHVGSGGGVQACNDVLLEEARAARHAARMQAATTQAQVSAPAARARAPVDDHHEAPGAAGALILSPQAALSMTTMPPQTAAMPPHTVDVVDVQQQEQEVVGHAHDGQQQHSCDQQPPQSQPQPEPPQQQQLHQQEVEDEQQHDVLIAPQQQHAATTPPPPVAAAPLPTLQNPTPPLPTPSPSMYTTMAHHHTIVSVCQTLLRHLLAVRSGFAQAAARGGGHAMLTKSLTKGLTGEVVHHDGPMLSLDAAVCCAVCIPGCCCCSCGF